MNGPLQPDRPRPSVAPVTAAPAAPAPAAPAPADRVIDLGALLGILWQHKLLLAVTTSVAVLLGGYYAYILAVPTYSSSAMIVLNSREEQVIDFESVVSGLSADSSVINTEVHVLRSRSLLGKVVDALTLTEDPEFNHDLRPPSLLDTVTSQLRTALGIVTPSEPLSEEQQARRTREATINGLLETVTIRNLPSSLVFQITVSTMEATKSAEIADELARQYIRDQIAVKFEATAQATAWLANQVGELQAELEVAESNVANFRATANLVNDEELAARERQVSDLRNRISDTATELRLAEERLGRLEAAGTPAEQAAAAEDSQLQQFLPRLSQESMATLFEQRFAQIVARARLDVSRLQRQDTTLRTSLSELEEEIDRQGEAQIAFQQLTREAEAIRLLYESFLRRLNETSAQEGIQQSDSRMLSPAVVPLQPSAPNKRMILALSGFVGFMVGAAIAFLRVLRHTAFRGADELEAATGRAVVGQIPALPTRRRANVLDYLIRKPTSRAAESVRNMRTSVLLSNIDHPPQTIMICSSLPGEGKTTLSMALAQNLAAMGKRVLVVEGDIRRRVLGLYLDPGMRNAPGYLSVLDRTHHFEDIVIHHDAGQFDVLLSGDSDRNAADVLSSDRFRVMIEEARARYDHVIIDTPPVLVVPDARIVARQADYLLLAVCWNRTARTQVREAMSMFESVGRPVDGLVLNQIKLHRMKSYGYKGYYNSAATKYYAN